MIEAIEYDVQLLIINVLVVAVASMGNVQWLKNWFHPKTAKGYAMMALVVLLANSFMQTEYVSIVLTWFWNLVTLANAVMQFGYEAIIQGVPRLIEKVLGGENADTRRVRKEIQQ